MSEIEAAAQNHFDDQVVGRARHPDAHPGVELPFRTQVQIDGREELLLLIRSLNYYIHEHLPPLFNPSNFRGSPQNDFGNIVSINVLCIPVEQIEQWTHVTRGLKAMVPASPKIGKSGWAGVCRMGGVGDNLIAASVLRPLKEMGYKVEMITQRPHSVLYENNPFIDKLSVYGEDDWKLIVTGRKKETVELYNLADDPAEKNDLAWKKPSQVAKLRKELAKQQKR